MDKIGEIQEIEKMYFQLKIISETNKYLKNFDDIVKNN